MARILIIDDEDLVRFSMADILTDGGHDVLEATNGKEAIALLEKQPVDLVITDILMPEQEGLETIAILHDMWSELPIVAVSGGGRSGKLDFLGMAKELGANATLSKPFSRDELMGTLAAYV